MAASGVMLPGVGVGEHHAPSGLQLSHVFLLELLTFTYSATELHVLSPSTVELVKIFPIGILFYTIISIIPALFLHSALSFLDLVWLQNHVCNWSSHLQLKAVFYCPLGNRGFLTREMKLQNTGSQISRTSAELSLPTQIARLQELNGNCEIMPWNINILKEFKNPQVQLHLPSPTKIRLS